MEVKNVDPKVQTYLSSRVMSIAANEMKASVVMAPCNGCYHNLKKAEYDLAHDAASRETVDRISKKAGHETYQAGSLETIHALDWIKDGIGEDELQAPPEELAQGPEGRQLLRLHVHAAAPHLPGEGPGRRAANPPRSRTSWTTCSPPPAPRTSTSR